MGVSLFYELKPPLKKINLAIFGNNYLQITPFLIVTETAD
jgi:hypothetical protein